ncbi:MAG: N-acetyltransferase [Lewinella sp.]|nr:N-acetyltransferase [Lewinella sp.]
MADYPIRNNPEKKRFELSLDGRIAFVDYILLPTRIIYTHTDVPPALEGRGVGSALARHVLDFAREQGLSVQPLCPFIASYMRRHREEYEDLLAPGFRI